MTSKLYKKTSKLVIYEFAIVLNTIILTGFEDFRNKPPTINLGQ